MGYHSYYRLKIYEANENFKQIDTIDDCFTGNLIDELEAEKIYDNGMKQIGKEVHCTYKALDESLKWYDCEDDMIKLSEQEPDYVFVMYRMALDEDDYEVCIFYEGHHESIIGEQVIEYEKVSDHIFNNIEKDNEPEDTKFFFAKE